MQTDEVSRRFAAHVRGLQDALCAELRALDPALELREDVWTRVDEAGAPGGGGVTRVVSGALIESGGVNTSEVYGEVEPSFLAQLGGAPGDRMWATGVSVILHPRNPRVPTVHANFRMIRVGARVWFGGGADLTPYYPHLDDFVHFHRTWADACAPLGTYAAWKDNCDRYFVNHHRDGELRGIGGVFFDHYGTGDVGRDADAVIAVSEALIPSWAPIARRRRDEAYTPEDEAFMLWRHGRYVEFNLLHDRGTTFGLRTRGRTASILVSLPARCAFTYEHVAPPGSPAAKMKAMYRPIDWIGGGLDAA